MTRVLAAIEKLETGLNDRINTVEDRLESFFLHVIDRLHNIEHVLSLKHPASDDVIAEGLEEREGELQQWSNGAGSEVQQLSNNNGVTNGARSGVQQLSNNNGVTNGARSGVQPLSNNNGVTNGGGSEARSVPSGGGVARVVYPQTVEHSEPSVAPQVI